MADRRRAGRRKSDEASQKLTKEEDTIARFVRFNCPTKSTMFEGNEVHYFTGSKAVDVLHESKKYGANAKNPKFATRAAAVAFMRTLLEKRLFFRARKLVAKRKDDKKEPKEKEKVDVSKSPKKRGKKDDKDAKEKKKKEESDENEEEDEKEEKKTKEEDEKKKRKVKLELHHEQTFNDAGEVYVWIFDPTPLFKKVIGALMVLGTIAGCLFPLWPMWVRQGVYYVSLAGLGCFGVLIGVAIARTILFAIIWATTMGTHKLWLLPNLTEDCGFFESFHPWYTYEYCPSGVTASGKKKKKGDEKKKTDEEEALLEKKVDETDGLTEVPKSEEEVKEEARKEKKENEERNGEEAGSLDSEEGSATDEDEGDSSQGTNDNGSGDAKDEGEERGGEKHGGDADGGKVRQRRRARRADDDFVLVDKQ